jgi:hypothetical protein
MRSESTLGGNCGCSCDGEGKGIDLGYVEDCTWVVRKQTKGTGASPSLSQWTRNLAKETARGEHDNDIVETAGPGRLALNK